MDARSKGDEKFISPAMAETDAADAVVLLRHRDHLAWRVNAGLRLLSSLIPQYGEVKWYGLQALGCVTVS